MDHCRCDAVRSLKLFSTTKQTVVVQCGSYWIGLLQTRRCEELEAHRYNKTSTRLEKVDCVIADMTPPLMPPVSARIINAACILSGTTCVGVFFPKAEQHLHARLTWAPSNMSNHFEMTVSGWTSLFQNAISSIQKMSLQCQSQFRGLGFGREHFTYICMKSSFPKRVKHQ